MSDFYDSQENGETISDDPKLQELASGLMLCEKYRLENVAGVGGMGVVWKAWDVVGERWVALKFIPPEIRHSDTAMEQVKTAFQTIQALNHTNIGPVYGLEKDDSFGYFIVKKWLEGKPLSKMEIPPEQIPDVLAKVADALDYAHSKRVMHRDVKPSNIYIETNGDVFLIDFGIAAEIQNSISQNTSSTVCRTSGTRPYMAPEQWRGQFQDGLTDQYALGVVAYQLYSGHLPFQIQDLALLRMAVLQDTPEPLRDVPPAVNAAIMRALSKGRKDRFASCREFIDALTGKALPEPSVPRRGKWKLPVLVALLILAGLAFFFSQTKTRQTSTAINDLAQETALVTSEEAPASQDENLDPAVSAPAEVPAPAENASAEEVAPTENAPVEEVAPTENAPVEEVAPAENPPAEVPAPAENASAEEVAPAENAPAESSQLPSSPRAGDRAVLKVDDVEFVFHWCPPGTFTMGSPESEPGRDDVEKPHQVMLTKGFWMLETEVTQAQWKAIMGTTVEDQAQKMLKDDNEYDFGDSVGKKTHRDLYGLTPDTSVKKILVGVGPDRPMYYVNWQECVDFCHRLSDRLNQRVQLPTEAQWEYACRAGSTTALPNGDMEIKGLNNAPALDQIAWYAGNSSQHYTGKSKTDSSSWREIQYPGGPCGVHPVGKKKANAWGLYDMIGNVWEWCSDFSGAAYYEGSLSIDPENAEVSPDHVNRGGGWDSKARDCRSACRGENPAGLRIDGLGFRLCLIPAQAE